MSIGVFDIETIYTGKDEGKFLLGGVYNGVNYHCFKDRLSMKNFMVQSCFKSFIWFAHNLEYDLNRIFLDDEKIERFYLGGRLIFARYPLIKFIIKNNIRSSAYIYFWDSYNLSLCSLSDIGIMLGNKKHTDYYSNTITEKLIIANEQDCKITYQFLISFQKTINNLGGNLKPTLASISIDLYRRHYMPKEAEFWMIKPKILEIFRTAYFGGRCEAYFVYPKIFPKIYNYDINSAYPYAMLNDIPLLDTFKSGVNIDKEGITYCKIKINKNIFYPPLPYRGKSKLLFPCGNWQGFYFNNEVRGYIGIKGVDIKLCSGFHYQKAMPIFKKFILDLYDKRLNAETEIEKTIYKGLMNRLYGRFALKNLLEKWVNNKQEFFSTVPVSSNVIWSAYITAYARKNLYDLITSSNAVYSDTDSSFSVSLLDTNKKLGHIGLKGAVKDFYAISPKNYFYNINGKDEHCIKGIPRNAKLINNEYIYHIPIKYKSAKVRKLPLWSWITVRKSLTNNYDKRKVLSNGDTIPLIVSG